MTDLVRGEASESDDETKCGVKKKPVFASEISGEASESESENELYSKDANCMIKPQSKNILQQLLIRNNVAVWTDLNAFVNRIISESTKPLLSMEHLLIKTQMTFSSMLSSLKIAQNNVKQLHEKASNTFTINLVPNIKMK